MLSKPKDKKTIVFLCTGDTCRGPMAQGYMLKRIQELGLAHLEVKTAGVLTVAGLVPTPEAKQVMQKEGVDIAKHRSAALSRELISRADYLLGMTPYHVQIAKRMADEAQTKAHLLKEFAKSDPRNFQINDPMGATLEVYKRVFREIKMAVDRLLEMPEINTPPAPPVSPFAKKPVPPSPAPAPAPVLEVTTLDAKKKPAPAKAVPAAKPAPAKKGAAKAPAKPAPANAPAKPAAKAAPAKKAAAPAAKKPAKPAASKK
jgi:protein-tyrosine-phosphatase